MKTIPLSALLFAFSVLLSPLKAQTVNGYQYVDLGLDVLWATHNIGSTSPKASGDFFAWGETQPKADYSTDTYRWMNSEGEYTKYVRIDGRNIVLSADDDAATQQWGTPWRMPTMYDIEDLLSLCTYTYQWDNSYGYIYTITGPNGNSITLSCTGTAEGTQQPAWGLVLSFLTATLANDTRNAYILGNDVISNNLKVTFARRHLGFNIRPVISKNATAVNNVNGIANGNRNGGWYTLNGQRLNTAPTQQGLYIHNGKKAVVK